MDGLSYPSDGGEIYTMKNPSGRSHTPDSRVIRRVRRASANARLAGLPTFSRLEIITTFGNSNVGTVSWSYRRGSVL